MKYREAVQIQIVQPETYAPQNAYRGLCRKGIGVGKRLEVSGPAMHIIPILSHLIPGDDTCFKSVNMCKVTGGQRRVIILGALMDIDTSVRPQKYIVPGPAKYPITLCCLKMAHGHDKPVRVKISLNLYSYAWHPDYAQMGRYKLAPQGTRT